MKTTPTIGSPGRRVREVARHVERHTGFLPCLLADRAREPIDLLYAPVDEDGRAILVVTAGGAPEEWTLCLPAAWPLAYRGLDPRATGNGEDARDDPVWPLRMLRELGRTPTDGPARGTVCRLDLPGRFAGVLLDRPILPPLEFERLATAGDGEVRFVGVIPLLPDEVAYAERRGAASLRARLLSEGVSELVDPVRRSALARSASRRAG